MIAGDPFLRTEAMHTLVTMPLVNRYGTRLFVMCVFKPVHAAPTAPQNERHLCDGRAKK